MHFVLRCFRPSCLGMWLLAASAQAQISYTGGLLRQDFDSLPAAGSFDFSDFGVAKGPLSLSSAPVSAVGATGWGIYAQTGTQLLMLVDNGSLPTSAAFSYGAHAASDRGLGSLAGSNHRAYLGWRITNNTGQTLTQFTITLQGEQWRNGGISSLAGFEGEYRIAASGDINSGTYADMNGVDVPALVAITTGGFSLNGNSPANRAERSATVGPIVWPAGQLLILRWRDIDETGADHGLALDDVLFFAPTTAILPQVAFVTPVNAATKILTTAPIVVTFNQAVTTSGAWFELTGSISGPIPAAATNAGPMRHTITPAAPLAAGETVTLRVVGSLVTNATSQPMAADFISTFTTLQSASAVTRIHDVQGGDGISPLAGATVSVQGVVTADFQGAAPALGGFFLQEEDADADGNAATSEGIWISDFTSVASIDVVAGDVVRVTGTVSESGSLTQLNAVTAVSITGTAPLPSAINAALPQGSGIFLERHESMRVHFPQTLSVTSNTGTGGITENFARFGELILAADGELIVPTEVIDPNDTPASGTTSAGRTNVAAVHAREASHALRTLVLDDASTATYPDPTPFLSAAGTRRCGDTVTGLTGVLSYSSGVYRVQPVGTVPFVDSNPRPATPPPVSGRIKVSAMNVLNYFITFGGTNDRGAGNSTEFQRQKDKIIAALGALNADVLGLIEIQNTPAAVNDILTALNAAVGADPYVVVPEPSGGAAGDFIRCVLLYRPSRISISGPCHADYDIVWNTPNPLRYPLAQVFVENSTGERFIACLNHWKSKSSSGASGLNTDQNDGQGAFNEQRRQQAARLLVWLAGVRATSGDDDVLILGDLNSLGEEDPLDVLRAGGCIDQGTRFHPGDYSYRLGDARGRLDHAFATLTMNAQVVDAAHWHINADEPAFYDYNMENKTAAQLLVNAGTPFRSSDHDPVLIGISLSPQPTTFAMWSAARAWPGGTGNQAGDDPDLDGMKNLVEFMLNTNPLAADPALAPAASITNGDFRLLYRLRTNASGVTVQPQWSANLLDWFPMTTGTPTTLDSVTVLQPATVPVVGQSRLFGRLKIELTP